MSGLDVAKQVLLKNGNQPRPPFKSELITMVSCPHLEEIWHTVFDSHFKFGYGDLWMTSVREEVGSKLVRFGFVFCIMYIIYIHMGRLMINYPSSRWIRGLITLTEHL